MYARLSTYRYRPAAADPAADPQRFLRLLAEQTGCCGAYELSEADDSAGGDMASVYFSLWQTREQAEAAGVHARSKMMALYEAEGISPTGPPEVRIFEVSASSVAATATG